MSHFQDFDLEVTSILYDGVQLNMTSDCLLSDINIRYVEFTSFKNSIGFSASHI